MNAPVRYRLLLASEALALSPPEQAKYAAERRAFDLEVETIKERILAEGRLEVHRGIYLPVPVPRAVRGRSAS